MQTPVMLVGAKNFPIVVVVVVVVAAAAAAATTITAPTITTTTTTTTTKHAWSSSSLLRCRSCGSSVFRREMYSMPPYWRTVAALLSNDGGTLRPDRSSMAAGRLKDIS